MKNKTIIFYSLFVASLLYYIEQDIGVDYVSKTVLKIFLFLVIPFIYTFKTARSMEKELETETKPNQIRYGLIVGLLSFIAIFVAYNLLGRFIDLGSIQNELQNKLGITAMNFIFVGLYITFVNSLLEEYFFRNFIFLSIFKSHRKIFAYIYSSALFSLYHIAIFAKWFEPAITIICIVGLFTIGLIYNFINSKKKNFVNSWIAHMMADSAIILIGLNMFGII